jgi:hypothetical protein
MWVALFDQGRIDRDLWDMALAKLRHHGCALCGERSADLTSSLVQSTGDPFDGLSA